MFGGLVSQDGRCVLNHLSGLLNFYGRRDILLMPLQRRQKKRFVDITIDKPYFFLPTVVLLLRKKTCKTNKGGSILVSNLRLYYLVTTYSVVHV